MNEIEKMKAGMWYDANYDQSLVEERLKAQDLYHTFNQLKRSQIEEKTNILKDLLGYETVNVSISAPFYCDYGYHILFGENVFVNLGCYFMDGAPITVGNNVFIGPYTGFYTAAHPNAPELRNHGLEQARPITIGDNCWFGANVSVMPGVSIGANCVIAAGAVVTKDMPDNAIIAGVPAKVIRLIDERDYPNS